ncbi:MULTISPECIES: hypothetical protein [Enterobacterales]|uniref:hypothetical protein n=1 Tax=Enterobacterales TaxID=91347 RepID=UPI002ED99E04
MSLFTILLITFAAKTLISFVVYLKTKHVIARMSLPAKGMVISSSWLFSYGISQLVEEFT